MAHHRGLQLAASFVSSLPDQDAAIKALAAALAPKAKVLRDGKLVTLEALNLVPGAASSMFCSLRPSCLLQNLKARP